MILTSVWVLKIILNLLQDIQILFFRDIKESKIVQDNKGGDFFSFGDNNRPFKIRTPIYAMATLLTNEFTANIKQKLVEFLVINWR